MKLGIATSITMFLLLICGAAVVAWRVAAIEIVGLGVSGLDSEYVVYLILGLAVGIILHAMFSKN